ncbi:GLUG motif-containing protein, partial [Candidatus Omnitrophota bacterium]
VGKNDASSILYSYSTGSVTGTGSLGGFIGANTYSTVFTNNFWDKETSGKTNSVGAGVTPGGITGKTTAEMKTESTFTGASWDFSSESANGTDDHWIMMASGYPHLTFRYSTTITDVYQLQLMAHDLTASYTLANDIDASETAVWNSGAGFDPIGDDAAKFSGTFNGNGYVISNLFINADSEIGVTEVTVGLFGYTNGATVENIGLLDVSVTGTYQTAHLSVGALIGYAWGTTITNVYSTGSVESRGSDTVAYYSRAGGLVGTNWLSGSGQITTITDSYSTANVESSGALTGSYAGGLIGQSSATAGAIVRIVNSYATGNTSAVGGTAYAAGLAGTNNCWSSGVAEIIDSYATGNVTANGANQTFAGGLVGRNRGYSTGGPQIINSYATGNATATGTDIRVGGLVGRNDNGGSGCNPVIKNSYATGVATGSSGHVGGLVGDNIGTGGGSGTITNSWWYNDINTYGIGNPQATGNKASAITDFHDVTHDVYDTTSPNWDFSNDGAGTYGDWIMAGYPHLTMEYSTTITNVYQLQMMALDLDADYTLANDINASETSTWNYDGSSVYHGFDPIGQGSPVFTGTFNGDSRIISNLTINRHGENFVGLFGSTNGATIQNVGLENVDITSDMYVGGLVGNNTGGTISNSYSTGSVHGDYNYVGGLVGNNDVGSTISYSYTAGTVSGPSAVGGLVGYNKQSTISDSYSTSDVTGSGSIYVGGLTGRNYTSSSPSTISNSYATGSVTAPAAQKVGGLVGENSSNCTISNSYSTSDVTGASAVGGLIGNDAGTVTNCRWYNTTNTDGIGSSADGYALRASGISDFQDKTYTVYTGSPNWDFSNDGAGTYGDWIMAGYPLLTMEYSTTITNVYQLQMVALDLTASYTLANDINASETSTWNGGAGFEPLGQENAPVFTGTFNGQGHKITGLYENRSTAPLGGMDVGLFGRTAFGSIITNVGLEDVEITGAGNYVGALVGSNFGAVSNCYSTGSVTSNRSPSNCVGGLIGYIGHDYPNGNVYISNSYSTASVSGNYAGGLVGINASIEPNNIRNSYATGSVTGTGSGNVGGFVGWNSPGNITNCYSTGLVSGSGTLGGFLGADSGGNTLTKNFWDKDTSNQTSSAAQGAGAIEGKTTAQMKTQSTFTGWDFSNDEAGTYGDWMMAGYPHLTMEHSATITNVYQLQLMALDLTADYTLANDINASETSTWNWNGSKYLGFDPVGDDTDGDDSDNFTGSFDGGSYTISTLTMDRSGESWVGLFGCTAGATIQDIGLEGVNIIDGYYGIGALVGKLDQSSTLSNAYSTGSVNGNGSSIMVGGLVGTAYTNSSIANCYSTVTVTGGKNLGGLIGNLVYGSTISNSYSTGSVSWNGSGDNGFGGLAGAIAYDNATIANCYSTSSVSGNGYTGGLVGYNESATVTNSYSTGSVTGGGNTGGFMGSTWGAGTVNSNNFWDITTSGQGSSAGATGKTTAQMMTEATFTGAGWDFSNDGAGTYGDWIMMASGYPSLTMRYSATITDAYQLQLMVLDLTADYALANDINVSETSTWNSGAGFDPVGDSTTPFTGTFNGNGYAISEINIDRFQNNVGLFGFTSGATISNVGLVGGSVTGGNSGAGANSGTGSLLGRGEGGTTISNCYADVSVSGSVHVGILVGYVLGDSSISDSYTTGSATGWNCVAGLAGATSTGTTISNSYSLASVTATAPGGGIAGGLVGHIDATTISNSYAIGQVTGGGWSGGLIGYTYGGTFSNNYSGGGVTSGAGQMGTFSGGDDGNGTYTSNFWDTDTSGSGPAISNRSTSGITGETTAQMKTQSTFTDAGWDFISTWEMTEGTTYPHLQWENYTPPVLTELTVTGITCSNKTYDGTTVATAYLVGLGTATLVGVVGDDDVELNTGSAAGAFASEDVADGIIVYITGLTIFGADEGQYILVQPTTTADITAKPIAVTADDQTKVFAASDPALTYTNDPLEDGDSFTGALSRAEGENVGTYAIGQGTLSAGSNYSISYTSDDLTITAKPIAVTADDQTKVFA